MIGSAAARLGGEPGSLSPLRAAERWYYKLFKQRLTETQILLISGVGVGIGAGVGAVVFRKLIAGCAYLFFTVIEPFFAHTFGMGAYAVILIPALGGMIFGPLIYLFAREAKGHGVPEVMLAVAQNGGKIRPVVAAVKSVASAVCIGSGGSVGREGPIVQIGSALGSTWGQFFRMSESRVRMLVAAGAAGRIAATFNAPIAGAFFAMEVILGEFSTSAFGVVVVASVTASLIGHIAFGNVPTFPMPGYHMTGTAEILLYVVLGLICAFAGVWFTKTLYWFEDRFDEIKMPEYLKPIPGGLMLGALGLFVPQIFGVGYPAMSVALAGHYALGLLAFLTLAKVLAVSLTIGSGGVFAPSLFVGAMLGETFGVFAHALFPTLVVHPANFGLVGMAAVFTAAARAPITAVIILFELTGDYSIILPLMLAVVISTVLADALSKESIYTLKLVRRGIDLAAGKSNELMQRLRLREAMRADVRTLSGTDTVAEAVQKLAGVEPPVAAVKSAEGAFLGVVTAQMLEEALVRGEQGVPLCSLAHEPAEVVRADESLETAVQQLRAAGEQQLPVFDSEETRMPVGLLSRDDVFQAYSMALVTQSK